MIIEGLPGFGGTREQRKNIVGNKRTRTPFREPGWETLSVNVDGGGRWEADMLNKEQIRKNCGNKETQDNFRREQGPL